MTDATYPCLAKKATLADAGFTARDLATARSIIEVVRDYLEEHQEFATGSIADLEEVLIEMPKTITEPIGGGE